MRTLTDKLGVSKAIAGFGVPSGAVVMAGVLLHPMGLPIEAMAIIMTVDRINDMFCTASNVVGDTAVNTIVAKMKANPAAITEAERFGEPLVESTVDERTY